jgi:uncharacterized protein (DUF488 family)
VEIYTIGFTKKTAAEFFGSLRRAGIKRLIDVRLNNTSQLAGFAKRDDLAYFLQEICQAEYQHEPTLSPDKELLDGYKKKAVRWEEYESRFLALLREREAETLVDRRLFDVPTVLLCSEPTAEHCHRRLVAEYLAAKWGDVKIVHL